MYVLKIVQSAIDFQPYIIGKKFFVNPAWAQRSKVTFIAIPFQYARFSLYPPHLFLYVVNNLFPLFGCRCCYNE